MKLFTFFLLLMPLYAEAATPELICAPEARITFQSRLLRRSIIKLETGSLSWELPWTGREETVSGRQLRADRMKDFGETPEAASNDELLSSVQDYGRFVEFKEAGTGQNPLSRVIYIDRALLKQGENDGLVITQQFQSLELSGPPTAKVSVFHCRSR